MDIKEYIETTQHSALPVSRLNMPQINDINDFKSYLILRGVEFEELNTNVDYYSPTQQEFDTRKVDAIKAVTTPIIVSKDLYVLDGHHRFFAALNLNLKIDVIFIDLDILDLFKLTTEYIESK